MKIEPKYYPFIKRVWLQINTNIYISVLSAMLISFTTQYVLQTFLLAIFLSVVIFFSISLKIHKTYLKSLEINKKSKYIVLEIIKYNEKITRKRIEFDKLDVRVHQILFSMQPYYKLQFFKNKALVFQQREFKEWNKEKFTEFGHFSKSHKSSLQI